MLLNQLLIRSLFDVSYVNEAVLDSGNVKIIFKRIPALKFLS
jgi:hypothetical protein